MTKEELEKKYYKEVPNARRINPVYRAIFEFFYEAHRVAKPGAQVLNVYASHDRSQEREVVYRESFFGDCKYQGVDWWHDKFIPEGKTAEDVTGQTQHTIPVSGSSIDVLVTTKILLEHVSEPQAVVNEFYRVLKTGGEAFVIAPLVRRQHQHPYDFFRYTEFGLQYLFEKAGFTIIDIKPTNGFMATAASYAYFFQRGLNAPKLIEKIFDWLHTWIIEPVFYALDRLDNGYGRDMTQYFLVRVRK